MNVIGNGAQEQVGSGRDSTATQVLVRGAAIILLVIGGIFMIVSVQLPFGSVAEPGSGFWPLVVSSVLSVLGLASVVKPDWTVEALETSGSDVLRMLLGFACLAVFIGVFWWLGYFMATAFLVVLMARMFGPKPWPRTILIAVVSGAVMYLFFDVFLALPSPSEFF